MRGYNFSEPVRRALVGARREAAARGSTSITTAHVLLGLLEDPTTLAGHAIACRSVDAVHLAARLRDSIEPAGAPGTADANVPYADEAKRAIERAMGAARDLGDDYVATAHLLLGVAADAQCAGGLSLESVGLSTSVLRDEYMRIRAVEPPEALPAALLAAAGRNEGWRATGRVMFVVVALSVLAVMVAVWVRAA